MWRYQRLSQSIDWSSPLDHLKGAGLISSWIVWLRSTALLDRVTANGTTVSKQLTTIFWKAWSNQWNIEWDGWNTNWFVLFVERLTFKEVFYDNLGGRGFQRNEGTKAVDVENHRNFNWVLWWLTDFFSCRSSSDIKFRQLADASRLIQLIYNDGEDLKDCEIIHQRDQVRKFLHSFKSDLGNLIATSNVTVESLDSKKLPEEFSSWFNFTQLVNQCKRLHHQMKQEVLEMKTHQTDR